MLNNPYWLYTASLGQPDWLTSLPDKAEVVIIGAGYAGLTTAITLAMQGIGSIILDSGMPCLKSGPRGNGTLFSLPLSIDEKFEQISKLTIENSKLFKEFVEMAKCADKIEFKNFGGLHLAKNDDIAEKLNYKIAPYVRELGVDCTWLPNNSVRKMSGIRYTDGALFVAEDCLFNPLLLGNLLVNINRNLLNKVFSGFDFAHIQHTDNDTYLVVDKLGNAIEADAVIFCINSYSIFNQVEALKIGTPLRAQYIMSKHIGDKITNIPPYALQINNEYIARTHNGHILFGGHNEQLLITKKELGIMADAKVSKDITNSLMGIMSYYFPEIDKDTLGPEYTWTANVYQTPDGLPVVGKIGKNLYINAGYNIDGMSYLFLASKIISELLLEYSEDEILGATLLSPERFRG